MFEGSRQSSPDPVSLIDLTYVKQTGESNGDAGDQYTGLDRFGRVVDQRWINGSGTAMDRYQYTYDRDGNITQKDNLLNSNLNEVYTYDNLNRLTSTDRNNGIANDQSWSLDALGNMSSVTTGSSTQSRATNDQNQLTGVTTSGTTQSLSYDNNGNATTDDQGHTLVYDAWNRLIEIRNGDSILEHYAYDGLGQRITEAPDGGNATELYYSAQWLVIEERTDSSGLTAHMQYVWSPVYIDAMVLRDYNITSSFTIADRVYALQDANYNVTALINREDTLAGDANQDHTVNVSDFLILSRNFGKNTADGDASGDFNHDGYVDQADFNILSANFNHTGGTISWAVGERFAYDAYGKFIVDKADWSSGTEYLAWNYLFQGGRYDSLTGLYDFRNRLYSPTMQVWNRPDDAGYINGMNDFAFVMDNPTNDVDPFGLLGLRQLAAVGQALSDDGGRFALAAR